MLITTQNEIQSLMPTARWDRPQQLFGYIEEEESVALEPLLGITLYNFLLSEYDRLRETYTDITATTVRPTGKAKQDARLAHADVTERLEQIQQGKYRETYTTPDPDEKAVEKKDLETIRLIRICQQIEFYRMLSHKAGLLTVSFNEGGGMNVITADGYDPAEEKRMDRVVKDAFMSAGRATDALLLFLEADAKGDRLFTDKWSDADAFYLHKDLLFQTARVLNEYLDIKGERMAYVQLVRDIRFCQNTYLRPRVGAKLLKAVVAFANTDPKKLQERVVIEDGEARIRAESGVAYTSGGQVRTYEAGQEPAAQDRSLNITVKERQDRKSGKLLHYSVSEEEGARLKVTPDEEQLVPASWTDGTGEELLDRLRMALAFYVESRRTELAPAKERLARRDSMTDAQQAMADACLFIEQHLESLGEAAVGSPIYEAVKERERQEAYDRQHAQEAEARRHREAFGTSRRKLFTAFPHTHRNPETK